MRRLIGATIGFAQEGEPAANDIVYVVFENWEAEDYELEAEEAAKYAYSRETEVRR